MSSSRDIMQLVQAAGHGEEAALSRLMQRVIPEVRAYVRLNAGERIRQLESHSDLVQSVCREVLKDIRGFRGKESGHFRKWLFTLAMNKVRMKGRHHKAHKRDADRAIAGVDDQSVLGAYASICTPSRHAMVREELERVEKAFERLPEDYRRVLTLARIMGLPHADVAVEMERSEEATRRLLSRARARLALELASESEA